ncbi:MAG: MerR family transcriptional regulator, partial [Acetivibrio sp.]
MNEGHYIISDASRRLKVEPHVLRYWEEELQLEIPRNEMGHRHYTEDNMSLLKKIKNLKEKGFQLKAIKLALPKIDDIQSLDEVNLYRLREELNQKAEEKCNLPEVVKTEETKVIVGNGVKIQQFKTIM